MSAMNEKPEPEIQISLQRLMASVAMFAAFFGVGVACVRGASEAEIPPLAVIGYIFLSMSSSVPIGIAMAHSRGGVATGFATAAFLLLAVLSAVSVAIVTN